MKNYPNIESRKLSPNHDYYVAYGGGHVWHVWKNTWKGKRWIAGSNTACFVIEGRILDDINAKLASL